MSVVDAFDLASLEAFTSDLVAVGFEPTPGTERRRWSGPINSAFEGLTDAKTMAVYIRDGWPFVFPVLFIDGLHSNHVTSWGYVCLWDEGDGSGEWQTVEGFLARMQLWCDKAKTGWDSRGLARDARLNFTDKDPTVATFDLAELFLGGAGGWTDLHAHVDHEFRIRLRPGRRTDSKQLVGLGFDCGEMEVPPRDFAETLQVLNRNQRKGLQRELDRRGPGDRLHPSGGIDFIVVVWTRDSARYVSPLLVTGEGKYLLKALMPGPDDHDSLLTRAGPDAKMLQSKRVVQFGVGALGGYVALGLASSGVGFLRLVDVDQILPGNVVRHVAGHRFTGAPKTSAVSALIADHAPWATVEEVTESPNKPSRIAELLDGIDLVIDATGEEAATQMLATAAAAIGLPIITGALYRGGAVAKVQRQGGAGGDTPILNRTGAAGFLTIPPGPDEEDLVEPAVGCSSPINNAPPGSVTACSALMLQYAVDVLTGRFMMNDEVVDVYRPLAGEPPFDLHGRVRR